MESFAHTLLGLSLAKSGLERTTPLACTTLVVSSNLPDIDVVSRAWGTLAYLEYHRGFTHSLTGLFVLAAALTLALSFFDRRLRLRRDPFRRPMRPLAVFGLALLGGLGHSLMDCANSYGIRPLLPFSNRWVYGDLAFVVDPWIWLILGSAVVWLSARDSLRVLIWVILGILTALPMAFALREPSPQLPLTIPTTARVIWFAGLAVIAVGAVARLGTRGPRLARYSLMVLALYLGGMWMARESALEGARKALPIQQVASLAAWPTPANPLRWQVVGTAEDNVYSGYVDLARPVNRWREFSKLEPRFVEALRRSAAVREYLDFVRYTVASVEEREGGYLIVLRDIRFSLRMDVWLNGELAIQSTSVSWF